MMYRYICILCLYSVYILCNIPPTKYWACFILIMYGVWTTLCPYRGLEDEPDV